MKGAQGARDGWILPRRAQRVFGDPLSQAGGPPGFILSPAPVPELPSLQEGTASTGLGLMPWRCPCPHLTLLQVRPPGDPSLLCKADLRSQLNHLFTAVSIMKHRFEAS